MTLRGFTARATLLQKLFSLPGLRLISIAHVGLINDGCWLSELTALRTRKRDEVHLSGWLADNTMMSDWFSDTVL
jgi:hypothetical protein